MKLKRIAEVLGAEIVTGSDLLDMEVEMACGSDLMSDVLAFVKSGALLLTGLTNPQVVRTAEMADLVAICFVRGKRPDKETVQMAESKKIPLLISPRPMFESCGRLHGLGLSGCSELKE